MAVQQNKKSASKRNMHRAHDFLTNPPLAVVRAAKNLLKGRPRAARGVIYGLVDGYRGIGGKWKWHDREAVLPGGGAPPGSAAR